MDRVIELFSSGVTQGAVYAAVGLALVLIWRATRIINFAQGGMLMITSFIASSVISGTHSYWLGFATAIVVGLALGAVVERTLVRRVATVAGGGGLAPIVVTLGLLSFLQALAGMIWGNTQRSFPPAFSIDGLSIGGTSLGLTPNDVFVVVTVVVVAAALAVVFRTTDVGLRMRAAAFAPETSRLAGVRVGSVLTLGWALAAGVGSIAGVLVAPSTFLTPNAFDSVLILGFTGAIIGGLDSPLGAVVGGIVLGVVLSFVSGYDQPSTATLVALAVLVVVLLTRPQGIFAARAERKI